MSVATDITALATKLSTIFDQIKTALAAKGVTGAPADYAAVPAKITSIVTGTGIDTSDATAAAGDIRSGKTAYVDGSKITGNLNLTARDSSDLYVTNNKVTAPAGLYAANASKTIATASHNKPTISVNASTGVITASHTQATGYVSNDTKSETYNLGTQSATTWTPTTTDQTIPQGKFLTGSQTIKGDSALVPSNIKSGVTLFNVTGNYTGGSGTPSLEWKWQSQVNVSRTSTKVLAISGLSVSSGETLVGLVLMSLENAATQMYYADALVVLPVSGGLRALITGYFPNTTTYWADSDFSLTKYGETACQLNSTGNTNFVESYRVSPIVAKVTA